MKHTKTIAYLRPLCCSRLNKDVVVPEFLFAVQSVMSSSSNMFSGLNESRMPSAFILQKGIAALADVSKLAPIIISAFFTPERLSSCVSWLITHPIFTAAKILDSKE